MFLFSGIPVVFSVYFLPIYSCVCFILHTCELSEVPKNISLIH